MGNGFIKWQQRLDCLAIDKRWLDGLWFGDKTVRHFLYISRFNFFERKKI